MKKQKMKRKFYTIKEVNFIKQNYESMTQLELSQWLNRSVASIKNKVKHLGLSKEVNAGHFSSSKTPWNKGKRYNSNSNTQFKKGNLPATARPEGEMYVRNDRYAKLWYLRPISEKRVMPYHRYRWQQLNGEIPSGHVVAFKDGNTMNIADDNLMLKSRAQLAMENHAKCDKRAAGLAAWRKRCGESLIDQILQCRL